MFPPTRGPSSFHQFPSPRQASPFLQGPYGRTPYNPGPTRGLQGLLQRFIPSSNTQAVSGGGVTNTLGNIQQVLKMAQSAAPMIQQYGPMVKNLPAMLKMVKAFNEINADDDENGEEADKKSTEPPEGANKVEVKGESLNKIESNTTKIKKASGEGISTPKLFIPQ